MGIGIAGETGGEDPNKGMGSRAGDPGRLAKELVVGVLGVLDGRGPGSTGRIGKFLNIAPSLRLSRGIGRGFVPPVGTDGSCKPPISSSSSIEGNICENSVM